MSSRVDVSVPISGHAIVTAIKLCGIGRRDGDHFLYVQIAPRIELTHLGLTRARLRNIEEIKNGDLARRERQMRMGCGSY